MYAKRKVTGAAMGIPVGLGLGAAASLLITFAGAALTAWLIVSEKIGEGTAGYAIMVILALASAAGSFVAVHLVKRLRLQVCMLTGGIYYLTLLAMTALLFGGQYQGMGVSAIIILGGCALIAFLPTKNNGFGMKRKKVYR